MTDLSELLERWLDVPNTHGFYQASSFGRVRSLFTRDKWGNVSIKNDPLVLRPSNTGRYETVCLTVDGKRMTRNLHVVVAETFLGPRPSRAHCAHLDGNRLNNNIDNLAWVSASENERHKISHGTKAEGSKHGIAKLTEDGAREIKATYRKGLGAALAKKYGVSVGAVVSVAYGRSWKHV